MTRRIIVVLAMAGLMPARLADAQEGWVARGTAELILLDKVRAQPAPVTVKVGESTSFGSITVRVRSCFVRPPDQPADSTAFVEVSDVRGKTDVFRGWLLAGTPTVSQMEHPVYDLRLSSCR